MKNIRSLSCLMLVSVLLFGTNSGKSYSQIIEPGVPGLQITSSSENEIIIDVRLPVAIVEEKEIDGVTCQQFKIAGYSSFGKPGEPSLPARAILVAVPPKADLRLEVINPIIQNLHSNGFVCPVPDAVPVVNSSEAVPVSTLRENSGQISPKTFIRQQDTVAILQQGFLRNQSVAQVGIFPVQYNPASGGIDQYRSFQIRLIFNDNNAFSSTKIQESDPFEKVLQTSLLNYEQGKKWRAGIARDTLSATFTAPSQPGYKFIIENEGIYEVTYADLQAAGVPIDTIDPRKLQLSQGGIEVPILIEGESDGRFDSGDLLRFYGWPAQSRYSAANVFVLRWDKMDGKRVIIQNLESTDQSEPPAYYWEETVHEKNVVYLGAYPNGVENDHWYQNYIRAPHSTLSKSTYTFVLPPLPDLSAIPTVQAILTAQFEGIAAIPQHHIKISLNGQPISDDFYGSQGDILVESFFHPSKLVSGENSLVIESLIDNGITSSIFYVNRFEVYYPTLFQAQFDRFFFSAEPGEWMYRVSGFSNDQIVLYDITERHDPKLLSGYVVSLENGAYTIEFPHVLPEARRYLIQTKLNNFKLVQDSATSSIVPNLDEDLMSSSKGADYIVITSSELRAQAENLASYRANQGLRAQVVDVQAIYDTFNNGIFDPKAIQSFIRYSYLNWTPPSPLYIVLFGDGHFDFLNFMKSNELELIPPFLGEYDPWVSETPSDNEYVSINGVDNFPDVFVGRIPVKSVDEANSAVKKIYDYEKAGWGEWSKQALFISDNPDSGGDFYASSDTLANLLPFDYSAKKVYHGIPPYNSATLTKAAIIDNINSGRGLSIYSGHGTYFNWASEQIFTREDPAKLNPSTQFPFSVSLDCSDGYFIAPSSTTNDLSSLSEHILRPADRGAIAVFAPAGWGIVQDHDILARGLFEAIFTQGLNTAGAATTYAKIYLAAHAGGYNSLIDTYILFGDPALQLKLGPSTPPQPGDLGIDLQSDMVGEVQPGDTVEFTLKYKNLGSSYLQQVVVSSDLPVGLTNVTALDTPDIARHSVQPNTWLITSLAPGATGQISFTGQVADGFTGELRVSALGTTTSTEADLFNNNDALAWQGPQTPHRMYYLPLISQEKP